MSDADLLLRLRARDETALETLYDRYSGLVFTLALRIVGDRQLAEEVLQDTFWRCWVGAEQFDPDRGRPSAWLLGVARNRAIDLLRGRQHQARLHERETLDSREQPLEPGGRSAASRSGLSPRHHAAGGPDPYDTVLLRDAVSQALGGLPSSQRQAIELAYYGALTQVEIAQKLGLPLGTIKTRIRDGMERLRRTLRPLFAADDEAGAP